MTSRKVWLITGAGRGMGADFANTGRERSIAGYAMPKVRARGGAAFRAVLSIRFVRRGKGRD
jgi:hypothetical protein